MEPTWGSLGSVARSEKRVEQSLLPACGSVARLSQLNTHVVQNSLNGVSSTSLTSSRSVASSAASWRSSRTVSSRRSISSEPAWAAAAPRAGGGALYIGPWQEMALGRALARHGERRGAAGAGLHAHQAAAPNPEIHAFMARFKEMAATMDEQGAQNLLRWSPLFMPTINSLIQPASADAALGLDASATVPVGTTRRARAAVASELLNVTDGGFVAAPKPAPRGRGRRGSDGGVRQQRDARVSSMRALYGLGGDGGGGGDPAGPPAAADLRPPSHDLRPSAPERPPVAAPLFSFDVSAQPAARYETSALRMSDELGVPSGRALPPPPPPAGLGAVAPMYAASPQASQKWTPRAVGGLNDDWEDEVDDLLKFTQGLDADLL